jgi:iron complex transport system ATP-binding protein
MTADPPLLELVDVSICRDQIQILDRFTATIPRGRHTAIVGPNGAGKTSLLKVLLRQFYPSIDPDGHQGLVRILGRSRWEVSQLQRQMGIVTAGVDLAFSGGRTGRMTVAQAVASGITATELSEFGVEITADVLQQVHASLRQVEAEHLATRQVSTLSTGERRRTLIARALVHSPSILVLDEPTTGLDLVARHSFLGLMRKLTLHPDLTLLLVTHHVDEIIPEIEYLMLLGDGRVACEGAKNKVLTDQNLSALYRYPIRVHKKQQWFSAEIDDRQTVE